MKKSFTIHHETKDFFTPILVTLENINRQSLDGTAPAHVDQGRNIRNVAYRKDGNNGTRT